jgi:hypothetical protein
MRRSKRLTPSNRQIKTIFSQRHVVLCLLQKKLSKDNSFSFYKPITMRHSGMLKYVMLPLQ